MTITFAQHFFVRRISWAIIIFLQKIFEQLNCLNNNMFAKYQEFIVHAQATQSVVGSMRNGNFYFSFGNVYIR